MVKKRKVYTILNIEIKFSDHHIPEILLGSKDKPSGALDKLLYLPKYRNNERVIQLKEN